MSAGYVYVLSNPSMPELVKIGRSKHGGRTRAKALHKGITGVPTPFRMEFELWSDDCVTLETDVHYEYGHLRVSQDREFFKMSPSEAIDAVLGMYVSNYDQEIHHVDMVITDQDVLEQLASNHELIDKYYGANIPLPLAMTTIIRMGMTGDIMRQMIENAEVERERRREIHRKRQEKKSPAQLKVVGHD